MNDKRKNFQLTFENIKSCLLELGFSGADEIIEKDSGKFLTGIQDEDFGMSIEITCKADIVNLKGTPFGKYGVKSISLGLKEKDSLPIFEIRCPL